MAVVGKSILVVRTFLLFSRGNNSVSESGKVVLVSIRVLIDEILNSPLAIVFFESTPSLFSRHNCSKQSFIALLKTMVRNRCSFNAFRCLKLYVTLFDSDTYIRSDHMFQH